MASRVRNSDDDLISAERDVKRRIGDRPFDFDAMTAVLNVHRCATVLRNHMEQTVLSEHRLSWTAFKVLWALWIWDEQEMGHVAEEANVSKTTLTGVVGTLESRGLVVRRRHPDEGRVVLLRLTTTGRTVIEEMYPSFNEQEIFCASALTEKERTALPRMLRKIMRLVESVDGPIVSTPTRPITDDGSEG
jgi:MarR family transcriptional regulator, organic hydroperoxide resistance regulator